MTENRDFTVAIYANDYKQICAWVLKNQTLETGGDLFGLWANDRHAVIQLVLGPGKDCQRAPHSFYQDVEYLKKVGSHLTGKEGVCHIGEWHSHHTIGLMRPSGGDERTVWRNMPNYGLNRFLLFIANIGSRCPSNSVSVGCFLFEFERGSNRRLDVLEGKLKLLPNETPLRSKFAEVLKDGAEAINGEEEIAALRPPETSSNAITNTYVARPVMSLRRQPRSPPAERLNMDVEMPQHKGRNVRGIKRRCPFCILI